MIAFLISLASANNVPAVMEQPSRLVVVPDVHGDLDAMLNVLKRSNVINDAGDWIMGKDEKLLFLGDLVDRGGDSLGCLDMVETLSMQAAEAGNEHGVVKLLGNHEMMLLDGDTRYFNKEELRKIGGPQALSEHFSEGGKYDKMLREGWTPGPVQIGEDIYCHAGIGEEMSSMGSIAELKAIGDGALRSRSYSPVFGNKGWLWYRGAVQSSEKCDIVDNSLDRLGASRMIVGHTVHDAISMGCDSKIVAADTAMSKWMGGSGEGEALEINAKGTYAVMPDGLYALPEPKETILARAASIGGLGTAELSALEKEIVAAEEMTAKTDLDMIKSLSRSGLNILSKGARAGRMLVQDAMFR